MFEATDWEQMNHAIQHDFFFMTHNRVHYEQLYAEFVAEVRDHPCMVVVSGKNVYDLWSRFMLEQSLLSKTAKKYSVIFCCVKSILQSPGNLLSV